MKRVLGGVIPAAVGAAILTLAVFFPRETLGVVLVAAVAVLLSSRFLASRQTAPDEADGRGRSRSEREPRR